ncbi:hypothetical protein BGW80DRAFT_75905 [Lactifluus volemus]|nr:hypothetical protein BGW80DRAFT_75905 [Lactifluus volemus]
MSYRAVLTSIFLFLLLSSSGFTIAEARHHHSLTYPACNWHADRWTWNSNNQSPCLLAAAMLAACNNGTYHIPSDSRYKFFTPDESSFSGGDGCKCSTTTYSLLAACSQCQKGTWTTWAQYSSGCTNNATAKASRTFPYPTPLNIPLWALRVIAEDGSWDSSMCDIDPFNDACFEIIAPFTIFPNSEPFTTTYRADDPSSFE